MFKHTAFGVKCIFIRVDLTGGAAVDLTGGAAVDLTGGE
jgi:hypothetical protein